MQYYENIGQIYQSKQMPIGSIGILDTSQSHGGSAEKLILGCKPAANSPSALTNEAGAILVAINIGEHAPHLLGTHFELIYTPASKYVFEIDYNSRQKAGPGYKTNDNQEFTLTRNAVWLSANGDAYFLVIAFMSA
jgi:hypothetical protein